MDYIARSMDAISKIARVYVKASRIKTVITVFVIGYAVVKAVKSFIK